MKVKPEAEIKNLVARVILKIRDEDDGRWSESEFNLSINSINDNSINFYIHSILQSITNTVNPNKKNQSLFKSEWEE